jgi:hypothetical protein
LIDILQGGDVDAHAEALRAIPPLLPVVLAETDLYVARTQHHAAQLALILPAFVDAEPKALVELHALLEIVRCQAGRDALSGETQLLGASHVRCLS